MGILRHRFCRTFLPIGGIAVITDIVNQTMYRVGQKTAQQFIAIILSNLN